MKRFLSLCIMLNALCIAATAQIPENYYESLRGKKGAELKKAIYQLIGDADVLDYGSGAGKTWDGFYTTDRTEDNMVIDRYSNYERYFTSKGASVAGMNIEHSFPKSWWGGSKNQAYQDLYNLMPCEANINSSKSNYPMGKVTNASTNNGCTKVGKGSKGYTLWEPADKWKGDFARGYMYMATAYQNLTWQGTQALQILENNTYPTLQQWAYTLYIEWAKADPVDALEVKRNNDVSNIQGNRNPFVDFPNLMEYVWGDSIDYAFDPEHTLQSQLYGPDPNEEFTVYYADFTSEDGGCWEDLRLAPFEGRHVWELTSSYGWKATAFAGSNHESDATLFTPEIDLTDYREPILQFTNALNYCTAPDDYLAVEVHCDGEVTTLGGFTWGTGTTWTFKQSGDIPLNEFAGKTIVIGFHYTSSAAVTGTWEIKNMELRAKKGSVSAVKAVELNEHETACAPGGIYTITGVKVKEMTKPGIYIVNGKKLIKK